MPTQQSETAQKSEHIQRTEFDGLVLGIWCVYMLYFIVRGIDWRSCNAATAPTAGLLPIAALGAFLVFACGYCVYLSFIGQAERIPTIWREFMAVAYVHYRSAPKTWTVTAFVLLALLWSIHGRYAVHYYKRGVTSFVRVEDRLLQTVTYRPTEANCSTDERDD